MKKITTKVIILMLIIPMLLVFTMGTTIDVTAIMLDIPVTSVNIEGDEILFVDVTSDNNSVKLNTVVNPAEASNKKVTYTTEAVSGEQMAIVSVTNDGIVSPKSVGSVKVVATTADGGRQDSVQINFYSDKASGVEQINETLSVKVGEKSKFVVGQDYNVFPSSANGSGLTYTSNNNKIKIDKYTGEFTGLFVGQSIVTAKVDGIKYDETLNKFIDTEYKMEFLVNVESGDEQKIFSFEAGASEIKETLSLGSKTVSFEYSGHAELGDLSYEIAESDASYVKNVTFEYLEDNAGSVKIELTEDAPEKEYLFVIKSGNAELGKLTVVKENPGVEISSSTTTFAKSNVYILFGSIVKGIDEGYVIRYESSNPNVFYVNTKDNECMGRALSEGTAYIKARLYMGNKELAVSEAVLFTVVNPYKSVGIIEAVTPYGLENRFVIGNYSHSNGSVVEFTKKLNVLVSYADGAAAEVDDNKLLWTSSDTSIATVDKYGNVNVVNAGLVVITVESSYNAILNTAVKSSFEVMCRKNGVNVYNYRDLMFANENGYETVLMANVMLADGITDNNYRDYLNNVATKEMATTADKAYYDDNNKSSEAKIRYCIEITGNVYGNGYYINADNITTSIDRYNYSVFNGPLDLIALKYGNNSNGNAKVKAQDNIVFLVKKDNIVLSNVELKGCSDSSLVESGQINLTKLNNVGTVLEIVGDNVSLLYSRVNNGRTVVRIYGTQHETDYSKIVSSPEEYKIETTISNCVLSYGREFILKVGSNQILRNESVYGDSLDLPSQSPAKYNHAAPFFTREDGENYSLTASRDEYFVDNYLMTDITLKDSVFLGAGLFCVGFDSQFAGLALHGYDYGSYNFSELGWQRVAGTSYPARIKMQGDVRFYDWKEVGKIDSSTIIEGDQSILNLVGLDLNVSNLLNKYNVAHPGNNFIYKYEGKDYINGAVVFYGGGKNYSWVDTSGVDESFNPLDSFGVPVSYFGDKVDLIYYAAGKEDFRFMTYNSLGNLTYETQRDEISDGSAYSWVIRGNK